MSGHYWAYRAGIRKFLAYWASIGLCRAVWALAEFIGPLPGLSSQNQKVPGLSGRYRTSPNCLDLGRVYRATTGLTEPESESSGLIGPISDFAELWDNARLHWSMPVGFRAFSELLLGYLGASCDLRYLWVAAEALLDFFGAFQKFLGVLRSFSEASWSFVSLTRR